MATNEVIIGAFYQHDEKKYVLKMESASVPDLDNYVFLIEKEKFAKQGCFIDKSWRGSWSDFFAQWTKLDFPNNVLTNETLKKQG